MVRFPRDCRCPGAWHVWRETTRTCETPSVPGGWWRICGWGATHGTVPDTGVCRKSAAMHTGKPTQLKEGWLKSDGESDSLIVL